MSAILLDAGGVLVFPRPQVMLPPLREAGLDVDEAVLRRAHYWAMAQLDRRPDDARYLAEYAAACGAPPGMRDELAAKLAVAASGQRWDHVAPGVPEAVRAIGPLGVVSNSDGTVAEVLATVGIEIGVVIDSGVVGVEKPDPEIFRIAFRALGVKAGETIRYVGDTLRYDVAGARAAGIRPVHLDPHGFCPAPDGHAHITSLTELTQQTGKP